MVRAMAKKRSASKFKIPPVLRKPIPWTGPSQDFETRTLEKLLVSDEALAKQKGATETQRATHEVALETVRRLMVLCESMGIDRSEPNWPMSFAYALARELCPVGFSVEFRKKVVGRQKVWTAGRFLLLLADVERIKAGKNCSDANACRILVDRAIRAQKGMYFPGSRDKKKFVATLENRLSEARNPENKELLRHFSNIRVLGGIETRVRKQYVLKEIVKALYIPEIEPL